MSIRTSPWPAGIPCWTDLQTPDLDAAKDFYGAVLDWSFTDSGEEYGGYAIANVDGVATAGIGPQQMPDGPSAWTMYLASDDADMTAAAITENGGTLLMPVGDVGEMGRMTVAMDGAGAVFGVWQAKEMIGAALTNAPGGLIWEDLRSGDPDAARAFYAAVFGHTFSPLPEAGGDYQLFHPADGEPPLGGMGGMFGMEGAPPHWAVYFGVEDADAAIAAATAHGGSVLTGPDDTPFGRLAGLVDPGQALFWIIQPPADMPRPDRDG